MIARVSILPRVATVVLLGWILLASVDPSARAQGNDPRFEGRRIPTLFACHGLATNEDDTRLYTVSEFDSIGEIDLRSNQFRRAFLVGGEANLSSGLAFAAGKLYVVASDRIVVLDPDSEEVLSVLPLPSTFGVTRGSAVTDSSSSRVYTVIGSSPVVAIIDVATDEITDTVEVGRDHVSLALAPGEDRLYVANPETAELKLIDLATLEIEASFGYATGNSLDIVPQVTTSPDGRVFVAYVSQDYRGRVSVFSADGTRISDVELPGYSTGIACSPDGSSLATGAGYVLDSVTGEVIAHVPTPSVGLYNVWFSRAGDRAFLTNDNDRYVNTVEGFQEDPPVFLEIKGRPAVGESLEITLDFPGEGQASYQLAASASLDTGVPVSEQVRLPLDHDTLFRLTLSPKTRECADFKGFLDRDGRGKARFKLTPHLPGLPPGSTLYFAAITFRDEPGPPQVSSLSNLVAIRLE